MSDVIHLALWKDEQKSVLIHYKPMREGRIEIISIDIEYRPRCPWQIRQAERREHEQRAEYAPITS